MLRPRLKQNNTWLTQLSRCSFSVTELVCKTGDLIPVKISVLHVFCLLQSAVMFVMLTAPSSVGHQRCFLVIQARSLEQLERFDSFWRLRLGKAEPTLCVGVLWVNTRLSHVKESGPGPETVKRDTESTGIHHKTENYYCLHHSLCVMWELSFVYFQ